MKILAAYLITLHDFAITNKQRRNPSRLHWWNHIDGLLSILFIRLRISNLSEISLDFLVNAFFVMSRFTSKLKLLFRH